MGIFFQFVRDLTIGVNSFGFSIVSLKPQVQRGRGAVLSAGAPAAGEKRPYGVTRSSSFFQE